jgi:hypothetical protein
VYLQEVLAEMLLAPVEGDAWMQALPPPLFAGTDAASEGVCLKGDAFRRAVIDTKACSLEKGFALLAKVLLCSQCVVDRLAERAVFLSDVLVAQKACSWVAQLCVLQELL